MMMRIAFVLDRHPTSIIGPILVQGTLDTDPVHRRFKQTGALAIFLHDTFLW